MVYIEKKSWKIFSWFKGYVSNKKQLRPRKKLATQKHITFDEIINMMISLK